MTFGAGNWGFRFHNYADAVGDRRHYQEGRTLEEARFRKGTLAEKIYQRLSPVAVVSTVAELPPGKKRKSKGRPLS